MKEYIVPTLIVLAFLGGVGAVLHSDNSDREKNEAFEKSCSKSCGIINHMDIDGACYCQTATGWEKAK